MRGAHIPRLLNNEHHCGKSPANATWCWGFQPKRNSFLYVNSLAKAGDGLALHLVAPAFRAFPLPSLSPCTIFFTAVASFRGKEIRRQDEGACADKRVFPLSKIPSCGRKLDAVRTTTHLLFRLSVVKRTFQDMNPAEVTAVVAHKLGDWRLDRINHMAIRNFNSYAFALRLTFRHYACPRSRSISLPPVRVRGS